MGNDSFQLGVILRIGMKNFVTYDEVEVKPGKNLNLIIGANGTGKSTIVSAIVLGLGGNPKVLGRATQVGHYVKAGQTKATIEIDLQTDHDKYVTVTRMFDTDSGTTWMVNNKSVSSRQIAELMRTFNIQVDNLCQFLPQDKVQEFSKLSPQDLLTETERSVGDPKLLENHTKLKQLRSQQAELEKILESKIRLQNKEKQTYDSLKDSVGHINEQKQIKKKLKTLKQKKAWILFQNKREEFTKAREGRDEAKKKMDQIKKKLQPVESEITKLKSSIQGLEKTAKQYNAETSAKTAKLNKFLDEIENYEKVVGDTEAQCEQKVREEQDRDQKIDRMKENKDRLENDLRHLISEVGTVEDIRAQLDATAPKMKEHKDSLNALKDKQNLYKEKVDHQNRQIREQEQKLQAVQDIENKRLDSLHKLSGDAYKGVLWLRSNQHLFSKPVHEPMLLHINLKDAQYSKYFENIIPYRDLTAFVCEDKNDMNLLVKYLRDQQRLKINVVHSDPNKYVNTQPSIPLHHIQQYGFQHYLISLIDAPTTILNYLLSMYRINEIPIGNDKVISNLEHVPDDLNRFFSTNNFYSVNRSKYTGEKCTRQAAISSRGILSITVDTTKILKIQQEMTELVKKRNGFNQELEQFGEKFMEIHRKIEALKEIRNGLQNSLDNIQNLKARINVEGESIIKLQTDRKSINEIRTEHKEMIRTAILEQLKMYGKYNKMLDDCYKNVIINEDMKLQIKLAKNKLAVKENNCHDLREECSTAERNYKLLENELTPLKTELKNLFDLAKESTGGLSYDDEGFTPIKTAFAKLPASLEEIFEEIQTTQAKIFCLSNDQQDANRILEQFNTAKKNLESLDEIIQDKEQELTNITEEIVKIKDEWLPMLENLVGKINNNFSNYFSKMKCAGEVSLIQGEKLMDFDKYGLRIKVKFRDTDELQALTRTHQSGGERAVTTAVYMIALQELTRVPFRCVDEINQGMDATNERRVFELIVDITSRSSSSQYFMLTPKLLPDLKYNDSITVLTVFSGKFMIPCSQFDMQDKCESIVKAVLARRSAVR